MRRTLAVAVLTAWVLLGLPAAAHAGGPTSVLVTQPESGRASALYYTSQTYAELERLLVADPASSEVLEEPLADGGTNYNLTWMIHDAQPWRLDNVHVGTDGVVWVASTDVLGAEGGYESSGWRAVAKSGRVAALLDTALRAGDESATSLPSADPEPTVAAGPRTRWYSLAGWRWLVPGVVAGLLVGVVVGRRAPSEPRRVLLDGPPPHRPGRRDRTALHP